MLNAEFKKIKTTQKELRNFGILVGAVLVGLAVWKFRSTTVYVYLLLIGTALCLTGMFFPRGLKAIYLVWMKAALVMGHIMTTIILAIIFVLIFVPFRVVLNLMGTQLLGGRIDQHATSYWEKRDNSQRDPSSYEKQY